MLILIISYENFSEFVVVAFVIVTAIQGIMLRNLAWKAIYTQSLTQIPNPELFFSIKDVRSLSKRDIVSIFSQTKICLSIIRRSEMFYIEDVKLPHFFLIWT